MTIIESMNNRRTRLSALIPTYKTQYSFSFSPYELLRLSMSTPGLLQFVQSQTQHLFWNSIMSIKKTVQKIDFCIHASDGGRKNLKCKYSINNPKEITFFLSSLCILYATHLFCQINVGVIQL